MDTDFIIVGAGISGLSLAWKLRENGFHVDVLESNPLVGGLAGTVREDGYCLDFGPHSFFSENTEIVNTVLKLFNNGLSPTFRNVKFYYKGKYLDYPLTAYSILFQMGVISGLKAGLSFLKGKLMPHKRNLSENEDETVEDWAIASFGKHLYDSFFKPYTEQFWKIPCTELSSRSIPTHTRMSFINTCRLLLKRRISKDGSSLIEREMLPTYYPRTGFGEIAELVAKKVQQNEGRIHLNCQINEIQKLSDREFCVSYTQDGEQRSVKGSHLISTIPLNSFINLLKPFPDNEILDSANHLEYRSLVVLGMVTEKQDILDCSYMYVLNRPFNRISEMNKFSPFTSPSHDNIVAVEIPALKDSKAWIASKEELFDMCIGSLAEDGFLGPGDVKRLLLIKASHAYPIYKKNYAVHLHRILEFIKNENGLDTLGRSGEFMYMDADVCMKRAFDLADSLKNRIR
jgi:protoporphyrinogen oxidase